MKKAALLSQGLGIGLLLALSATTPTDAQQAPASAARAVTYLNQAWSQEDREWYYQFSQGSTTISYDFYLNMEVAGSQELFRSDANSERYGLIPQAPNPRLQSGWVAGRPRQDSDSDAATEERRESGEFIGPNCAACHKGQLNYKGGASASMAASATRST